VNVNDSWAVKTPIHLPRFALLLKTPPVASTSSSPQQFFRASIFDSRTSSTQARRLYNLVTLLRVLDRRRRIDFRCVYHLIYPAIAQNTLNTYLLRAKTRLECYQVTEALHSPPPHLNHTSVFKHPTAKLLCIETQRRLREPEHNRNSYTQFKSILLLHTIQALRCSIESFLKHTPQF
jgi:hypothetical protein